MNSIKIIDTVLIALTLFPGGYFIMPLIRIFFLLTILIFQDFKDHFNWAFSELIVTIVFLISSMMFLPLIVLLIILYLVASLVISFSL